MKAVVQRVLEANLKVDGKLISEIGNGYVVFLGVYKGDTKENADYFIKKLPTLRILEDENGKINKSIIDTKGEMLIVSQFTLCGDCKKGTRPSFDKSAPPDIANQLYENFVKEIQSYNIKTQTGKFAAMMDVELINDGPVTFMIEM